MTLRERVGAAVASRALQLVGVAFGGGGVAHFWVWLHGAGEQFGRALVTGGLSAVLSVAVAYGQNHPAYVLAVLAGFLLVFRRY